MRVVRGLAALGIASCVGACVVAPPSAPSVMALPGKGKDLTAFQQDDAICRQYAASLLAPTAVPVGGGAPTPGGFGQPYDVSYTQCMFSRGDTVQAPPPSAAYSPGYPGVYPGYYEDVYADGGFGPFPYGPGIFIDGWHGNDGRRGDGHGPGRPGGAFHGGPPGGPPRGGGEYRRGPGTERP